AARIGGDEFLILLPQTRVAEGMCVAEKLRLAIGEASSCLSGAGRVSASVGLVQATPQADSIEELLSLTHAALKHSKQAGKNRVSTGREHAGEEDHEASTRNERLQALLTDGRLDVVR